jgi:acyl-CoA synthetase (AMP-forming)/AMP-acid ligase II/acyl carrier protein
MSDEGFARSETAVHFSSLPHLLEYHAARTPDAPAILAPGRAPLTYRDLHEHVEKISRTLRAMGVRRRDRVALVLPNGPEMAVAFLTVAASAVCIPINPAYGAEELTRYFADLRPTVLITQAGVDSAARRTAASHHVRVVELSIPADARAGIFVLAGDEGQPSPDEPVSPDDVALLLLTSGTTSRPKVVPQTHVSLCTSASGSVKALALRETDRCINIVPLFHGHGLHNTLLASLAGGGSVVCAPGCDVNSFFGWLTDFRPTWYSAVPTMHQAILARARHEPERAAGFNLRFIRCSSASLPPSVVAELERTFQAPVIEFYGMTEVASSPIACNPLPPRLRKPGSVGIPVNLDVAIVDEGGAVLPAGQTGQVMVRGASVMTGYDNDPVATQAAFVGDWLKTGDLGFFDDNGYLFLTGRVREIINRGGEKVTPQEVEEVLLEHPAIAEAVTFAVPHTTLGEDVAAAVVLRPGARATAKEIRQVAIGSLAEFKIPRLVLIVDEIPKGPTGKVQRIGLAAKLGLTTSSALRKPFVAPRTPLEKSLAEAWAEILEIEQVSIHDDFFALGGDSLLATQVLIHVYETTQIELEVSRFFEAPTVAEVAQYLENLMDGRDTTPTSSTIVPIRRDENGALSASPAQERLWELQNELPDIPFLNVLYVLRLTSPVDATILERSINEIVRRHEILRTTFAVVEGRHLQVIAPELTVPLEFKDLRDLRVAAMQTATQQLVREELLYSFDLARGPLFRTRLLRVNERTHLLLMTMHAIIEDGRSLGVLVDELSALYDAFSNGRPSPLKPLPIQYADFAYWQRHWRSYPDVVAQLAYWQEQLGDPPPVMKLGAGRPTQTIDDLRTARQRVVLPAKLSDAAKRFSQREGVTLFMTLMAAFKTLLHRYTDEDDLRVATHVANRNRPQTDGLIGPLVNMVVLRTSLGGDPTPREVLRRVRGTTVGAFANQDIPFEDVMEALERERALKPAALAQTMMWLQNSALRPVVGSGAGLTFEEVDPGMLLPLVTITTFDVTLMLREGTQGLVGTCVYKPHVFDTKAIDRLLRDFEQVLEHVITQPERPISEIPVSLDEKNSIQ